MIRKVRVPIPERFEAKIERIPFLTCWVWMAASTVNGYGVLQVNGQAKLAHRVAYELYKGCIPAGLQIDHRCRNRWCVNPAHLEAVTPLENTLRTDNIVARHTRQTQCKRGHLFSSENTYRRPDGNRDCYACRHSYHRRNKERLL